MGAGRRTSCQKILKADVEGGVGVRCEYGPLLASDILWLSVLVPYSIPDLRRRGFSICSPCVQRDCPASALTCMLTRIPSPLLPDTIAVTTTRVSLATKFRTHLSFLLSCDCEVAWRSNFRASAQARKSTILQTYCSNDRGIAMMRSKGESLGVGGFVVARKGGWQSFATWTLQVGLRFGIGGVRIKLS